MANFYVNNFESEAAGAAVAGWTNIVGIWKAMQRRPTDGIMAFSSDPGAENDVVLYTGGSTYADMGMKISTYMASSDTALMGLMLRSNLAATQSYLIWPFNLMGSIQLYAFKRTGSTTWTQIGSPSAVVKTPAAGQIVNVRANIVGQNCSVKVWYSTESEPAAATWTIGLGSDITAAGYAGLWYPSGAPSPNQASVDAIELTNTLAAATALTFSSAPTTGQAGAASSSFSLAVNGALSSNVVVTPSDGGAGGVFTPSSVTLTPGSPTGSFTYTASTTGAKTISVTNNGGLTNPGAVSYTASPAAATGISFSSAPTSGNSGAASGSFTLAANGALAANVVVTPSDGGAGGAFTPSSVTLTPGSPTGSFTYTPISAGNKTISVTNSGGLTNPSAVTYTVSTAPASSVVFSAAPSSGPVGVASGSFTVAANGTLATDVVVTPSDGGAGGAFTPTSVTLTAAAPSASFTYTPNTSGNKSISLSNSGGLANPTASTYNAQALATAVTLSTATSNASAGSPVTFTVGLNGATTNNVVVTPSDSAAGGSFSPATVTLTPGSPSATFSYTPASTGAKSVSVTNNSGLTNPTAVTLNVTAALVGGVVPLDNSMLTWSPFNWDTLSPGTFGVANKSKQTTLTGAYFHLKFTGSTTLTLTFDTASLPSSALTSPRVRVVVNNATEQVLSLVSTTTAYTISGSFSAGSVYSIFVQVVGSNPGADRFGSAGVSPANVIRLTGITLDGGATLLAAPVRPNGTGIVWGDSLVEGVQMNDSISYPGDRERSFAHYIGVALGAEVGAIGYGGQGWGMAGNGSVPNFMSAWNYHSAGRPISFSPAPDWVAVVQGTNGSVAASSVQSWITSARTALGANTWIFIVVPPGGFNKANLVAGVSGYKAAVPADTRVALIDVGDVVPTAGMDAFYAGTYAATDGVHIRGWVSGFFGAAVARKMLQAMNGLPSGNSGASVLPFVPRFFRRW